MKVHKGEGTSLDTDFTGDVPDTVTYHTPCHLKAQNIGLKSRDLIKLTGRQGQARAAVQRHRRHVGPARREHRHLRADRRRSSATRSAAGGDVVAGDCNLANTAIAEQTGEDPAAPVAAGRPRLRHARTPSLRRPLPIGHA
jgi:glycerol-3-phosphate dehydrogenase subunit C